MIGQRWLVDTSTSPVIAHRYTRGAGRSSCGQQERGQVYRGATTADPACGLCALRARAEIRAVVLAR